MESSGVWRMTCAHAGDKFSDVALAPVRAALLGRWKNALTSAGRMWKTPGRSIRRNNCENWQETPWVIARDRSDCGTRQQRGMGSVTRPAGASDGSKTQEDRTCEQSVQRGGRFYQLRERFGHQRHKPRRFL